jgi:hypothetical protein
VILLIRSESKLRRGRRAALAPTGREMPQRSTFPQPAVRPLIANGLPSAFRRIRLDLVREHGRSLIGWNYGYVFVAPLDRAGRIDTELWNEYRAECRVVRFRVTDEDVGHLVLKSDGEWAFHYDGNGQCEDTTGFHSSASRFVPGEYVSIKDQYATRTYRVTSIEHV